ncbi:helix-turn-helix transcriptional regulator [Spelaeicoccus albus]|uniref:Excisionase family DNA binding protein n=1 Tax=Spelaeicoccus albus TaxID=1280376 RepID=A0A7Z0CZA2_9MICO|nr:helix-turn-helix domain-containing protein [Spelaeicoccus albus]NYI66069.1 excisionase family DNA binding protein [Spelaeicoccus albus]
MDTRSGEARHSSLLTVEDLATQLGLSVSSIYRMRSTGESLPRAAKLGSRAVRWRQTDVDAWVEDHLEPSAHLPSEAR